MKLEHPITVGTADFNADQHSYYDWMRREAPVYRGRLALRPPDQDVYFVSRYRDCLDLVTDPRIRRALDGAVEDTSVVPPAIRLLTTDTMVYQDDPSHLRLRKMVSRPFTRARSKGSVTGSAPSPATCSTISSRGDASSCTVSTHCRHRPR